MSLRHPFNDVLTHVRQLKTFRDTCQCALNGGGARLKIKPGNKNVNVMTQTAIISMHRTKLTICNSPKTFQNFQNMHLTSTKLGTGWTVRKLPHHCTKYSVIINNGKFI